MKVTLQVNGREMTFSEQELIEIVEKHFSSEAIKNATTVKVIQKPTEGKWFEVKPQAIDQKLFEEKKEDWQQEMTRELILEAFAEMEKKPEYGKNFKTMMPERDRALKTVEDCKEMAIKLGDHMADWVEQALEWAQRISNGESWETICNLPDTAASYRLFIWKDGSVWQVGGKAEIRHSDSSAADIIYTALGNYSRIINTVPLVVLYEK